MRVCRELDLFGRELIAVDGTRIKAVNNADRNFTGAKLRRDLKRIDERLEQYLEQINEADASGESAGAKAVENLDGKIARMRARRTALEGHQQTLDESGEAQLSLTDRDSRAMDPSTRVRVGYNAQIAVDTKHNLIAEQQIHNKVSDLGLLAETAAAARENLGVDRLDAVADGGYYKIEDIERCEANGVTPYVTKPDRSPARNSGRFPKSDFRYDPASDTYTCPAGQRLEPNTEAGSTRAGKGHGSSATSIERPADPATCAINAPRGDSSRDEVDPGGSVTPFFHTVWSVFKTARSAPPAIATGERQPHPFGRQVVHDHHVASTTTPFRTFSDRPALN